MFSNISIEYKFLLGIRFETPTRIFRVTVDSVNCVEIVDFYSKFYYYILSLTY